MKSPCDDLQEGLEDMEGEVKAKTFTWRGAKIACMPGDTVTGAALGMGAPEPEESLLLKVRQNAFLTRTADSDRGPTGDTNTQDASGDDNLIPPQEGHILIYEQKEWEIERVRSDATGAYWLIYCVSPNS